MRLVSKVVLFRLAVSEKQIETKKLEYQNLNNVQLFLPGASGKVVVLDNLIIKSNT